MILFLFSTALAIITNSIRYRVNPCFNKWILIISSLLLIASLGTIIGFEHKTLTLFLMVVAAYCFQMKGGILAAILGWGIHMIQIGDIDLTFLAGYLFIGTSLGLFEKYRQKIISNQAHWHSIIIKNTKELNILREINMAMQDTHESEKILKIIATSVTAGHGLGFNRAMILLTNDEQTKMNGVIGVGPMSAEEGYKIWSNIIDKRYNLTDLIEIQEDTTLDLKLNEYVKAIEINLNQASVLTETLKRKEPLHVKHINKNDSVQKLLSDSFHMVEFVAFPLIYRGIKVGVLIIDNIVTQKEITPEEIDSVIPIANQTAIAIQQASLYEEVEHMALKDGLTGLMNHRSFQIKIDKLLLNDYNQNLSFIMIDIDFFKHYNDTNGHLLGNHVLIQMANVIHESIRPSDYSFRFGGEEFVVLLPNTNINNAFNIADQIRTNVENTNFPHGEHQPGGLLTISLGVASTELLTEQTANHLIDAADHALYQAKESGRNKVELYKEIKYHE